MGTPQFVDISQFQPATIDWQAYKAWSAQGDGVSRVAIRSSYGNGYRDPHFDAYRAGALAAGINQIIFYHYSYPSLNSAIAEANSQHDIVGAIRPQDIIILDFEESTANATAEWAYEWLQTQEANYGKLQGLYASSAYIQARLQDSRLARYPLWLANWQYTPDERPPVPAPWTSYEFVQYSDKASIPGVPGLVDADIFLGGTTPMATTTIPAGWTDDGTALKGPNGIPVILGFRDHVLVSNWDKDNWPLEPEQHLAIVEQSNPGLEDGQSQIFRWKTLEYTPKMGVFESWVGQELLWYQKQNIALQSQITALKTLPAAANLQVINGLVSQASTAIAQAGITIAKIGPLSQVQ
jgi:lysozyme